MEGEEDLGEKSVGGVGGLNDGGLYVIAHTGGCGGKKIDNKYRI